ncbi:GHKL domain-containing protein [Cohnella sp. AR92]|uniref:Spo0B domain-containing protein n=1 Tax=Cohnella sp. AR92 TaxID=648716 RepID=UPI000F8C940D|nr:GHKL domain-containing protein [Cohnella sp. AR92]RUS45078.1 GHKL domain-containing protein [Cohnella sp. AR92]
MTWLNPKHRRKLGIFFVVSVFILSILITLKVLMSYYATNKASQISLAKQYIAIAENIARGIDTETYGKVLAEKKQDSNSQAIRQYLSEYRSRINALYVYTLLLDETDVAKAIVASVPAGVDELPMLAPCTVPSEQVRQAKNGNVYYTDVIHDRTHGAYFSVGAPFYDDSGTLLGVIGIDIDASEFNSIGQEVVNSIWGVFGLDILYAVLILTAILFLHKWYRRKLTNDLRESEIVYISEMGKVMNSIKSSRHDLLNHFQVLNGLLHMQRYDKANEYIKQLSVESRTLDLSMRIKNPVLMVLLQSKWELAYSKNIELELETDPDEFDRVRSMDLVKIFTNLLDNAIEAVESYKGEQPKRIRVICRAIGDSYRFAVENPAVLTSKAQRNLFQLGYTTKPNEDETRGNGLPIVQSTVDKYEGEIRLEYENERVRIEIRI